MVLPGPASPEHPIQAPRGQRPRVEVHRAQTWVSWVSLCFPSRQSLLQGRRGDLHEALELGRGWQAAGALDRSGQVDILVLLRGLGSPTADSGSRKSLALSRVDACPSPWPELCPSQLPCSSQLPSVPTSRIPPNSRPFLGQTLWGLEPKAERKSSVRAGQSSRKEGQFLGAPPLPSFPTAHLATQEAAPPADRRVGPAHPMASAPASCLCTQAASSP